MHAYLLRKIKVNNASADQHVERDVCVLFEFCQFFFTLETRLHISKLRVDLQKF